MSFPKLTLMVYSPEIGGRYFTDAFPFFPPSILVSALPGPSTDTSNEPCPAWVKSRSNVAHSLTYAFSSPSPIAVTFGIPSGKLELFLNGDPGIGFPSVFTSILYVPYSWTLK